MIPPFVIRPAPRKVSAAQQPRPPNDTRLGEVGILPQGRFDDRMGFIEVSRVEQDGGEIGRDCRIVGIACCGLLQSGARFLDAPEISQAKAQIRERRGSQRILLEGSLEMQERSLMGTAAEQDVAEGLVRVGSVGGECERMRGERMPWYPSVRLFRQRRAGDWADVMERSAHSVRDWVEEKARTVR